MGPKTTLRAKNPAERISLRQNHVVESSDKGGLSEAVGSSRYVISAPGETALSEGTATMRKRLGMSYLVVRAARWRKRNGFGLLACLQTCATEQVHGD